MEDALVKEGSLGAILYKSRIITEEDIKAALQEQKLSGIRFGEALVKLGVVTQEDIDWALSNQLNIPYVRLKPSTLDPDATRLVPAALARKHTFIPLIRVGDELSIAIADPLNQQAIEEIVTATGCTVSVSIALIREIREMLDLIYGPAAVEETLGFSSPHFPAKALAAINGDRSGATLLNYLLLFITQQRLSSLSMHPQAETVAIFGKREGISREIGRLPLDNYPTLLNRVKRLAKIAEAPAPSARGLLAFLSKGKQLLFQAATLHGEDGELLTLKLRITSPFPSRLAEMKATEQAMQRFTRLTGAGRGIILFCSRDADDRSRLIDLYLDERDTAGRSAMLIGNRLGRGRKTFPRIPQANQADFQSNDLVLAALDHDPDIIAIEDATDSKSFVAAFKAAMRGKTVLAGFNTGDPATVFKHLLRFWQKNYFIPTYLKGIISCRGVLALCPNCREPHEPSREELAALRLDADCAGNLQRGVGCPECDQTGFSGRSYLLEVITFDEGLLRRFETARDAPEIIAWLRDQGHQGLAEVGTALLKGGEISPDEFVASILS